jgi:hypothetical protein
MGQRMWPTWVNVAHAGSQAGHGMAYVAYVAYPYHTGKPGGGGGAQEGLAYGSLKVSLLLPVGHVGHVGQVVGGRQGGNGSAGWPTRRMM